MDLLGPDRRRLTLAILAAAVAVTTAVVIGVVWITQDGETEPAPCTLPTPPAVEASSTTEAPDSGGLRVVEQGFTQLEPPTTTVSMGVVVENTSDHVAYRTRVVFRPYDQQGSDAVPDNSGELLIQEIPLILPGQHIGIGSWTYVSYLENGAPIPIAGFDIDLATTHWWPSPGTHTLTPITAQHTQTVLSDINPTNAVVTYDVSSEYCQTLFPRRVSFIFRDTNGVLIGGSIGIDLGNQFCQPGNTTESMSLFRSIPANTDDSHTEIYSHCDISDHPTAPTPTPTPWN